MNLICKTLFLQVIFCTIKLCILFYNCSTTYATEWWYLCTCICIWNRLHNLNSIPISSSPHLCRCGLWGQFGKPQRLLPHHDGTHNLSSCSWACCWAICGQQITAHTPSKVKPLEAPGTWDLLWFTYYWHFALCLFFVALMFLVLWRKFQFWGGFEGFCRKLKFYCHC